MALTIKSSNNFEVDVTTYDNYRKYAIKHKYSVNSSDSDIYKGNQHIEFIYAGKTLMKSVVLVDSNKELYYLYSSSSNNYYTQGSVYEHQYVGLKSDDTLYVSNNVVSPSVGSNIKANGIRFTPTKLVKINTTTHTATTGYHSDFGMELYHDGTQLYKTGGVTGCYMYYLNDYLVAVYNHSNSGAVGLQHFGGEVPLSIRHLYLPQNTLLFVCDRNISDCVNSFTPSSDIPSVAITNTIEISISSTLDSVVFKDSITPYPILS